MKSLDDQPGPLLARSERPDADRLSLDFELPASREPPRRAPARRRRVGPGTPPSSAPTAARAGSRSRRSEVGGGPRRRVLRLSGVEERRPGAGDPRAPTDAPGIARAPARRGGRALRHRRTGFSLTPAASCATSRIAASTTAFSRAPACGSRVSGRSRRLLRAAARGRPGLGAAFVLFLTLAATSVELWVEHNPYWYRARDLRVMLASGPVQEGIGANLNYGMYLGSRLLQGEGLTFGPGWVPWERMPGYGFFGALAGVAAGFKTDIFTIGLVSIELHLLLLRARERRLRGGGGAGDAPRGRGRRSRARLLHAQPARQHAGRFDHGPGLPADGRRALPLPRPRAPGSVAPVPLPPARPPVRSRCGS